MNAEEAKMRPNVVKVRPDVAVLDKNRLLEIFGIPLDFESLWGSNPFGSNPFDLVESL